MSDNVIGIIGGTIGIGQYIINDYVITITETEGEYGYTMTVTRGDEVQTISLYGLTPEQYNTMIGYLEQAQAAAQNAAGSASDAADYMEAAINAANTANTQAGRATQARNTAQSYASQAQTAKQSAETAKNDAQTARTQAQGYRQAAEAAATRAETAATNAGNAQTAAEAAQTSAEAAQSAAETAETNAQTYAGQAAQSATEAAQSAASAAQTLAQVQAEGQTQIAAIDAEGQRVIDSIPADYSQMTEDVADLKSQNIEDTRTQIVFDRDKSVTIYSPQIVQGAYNTSTGKITETNAYVRTAALIPFNSFQHLRIFANDANIRFYVHLYDVNRKYIRAYGAYANSKSITPENLVGAVYFALSLQRIDTSSAAPADITNLQCYFAEVLLDTVRDAYDGLSPLQQAIRGLLSTGRYVWYPRWEDGRFASNAAYYTIADGYIKSIDLMPVVGGATLYTMGLGTTTLLTEMDASKAFVKQTNITSLASITLQATTAFVGVSATSTGTPLTPADGAGYHLDLVSNMATNISVDTKLADYVTHTELETALSDDGVPAYFETQLAAKIPQIINNMNAVGPNGETFVFITDPHWETNYHNSPALIKRILAKTKVNHIICGGDLINQGTVKSEMYDVMIAFIRAFQFGVCDNFLPIARGNHDDNSNFVDQEDIDAYSFDYNTVFALLYKDIAEKVTFMTTTEFSFWYDHAASKTRYVYVDTRRDGRYIPYTQIETLLNATQDDYKVVFIAHYIYGTAFRQGATGLFNMIAAYNARTTGSYYGVNFDFTNAHGKAVCVIAGHTHADYSWAKDDEANIAGVPIIITDTDSTRNAAAIEGTTDSQCFDVITLDYNTNTIKCVRIGRGSDRQFTFD